MTIYICGDSTAASYPPENAPITGWGQKLENYTDHKVVNAARGGRSTKSFLSEGRLQEIECCIQPSDLLLIQFTHNDTSDLVWRHTDPWTSFKNNLSIYVDTARLHQAVPVLLTPICRRYFQNGKLLPSHGDYPEAIRTLAFEKNVPLIDIYAESVKLVSELGDEESRKLYLHVEKGIYPAYPDGSTDDTHTQSLGAETYARMTAEHLKKLKLI